MKVFNTSKINKEGGQMMMLMVMLIASATLATITFISFVLIVELRRVTDARLSTMALFAADSGIECILFREFGDPVFYNGSGCPAYSPHYINFSDYGVLSNGSKFKFRLISEDIEDGHIISIWEAVGQDAWGVTTRSIQLTLRQMI